MQVFDCAKRRALAVPLTIEDAVHGCLGRANLQSNAGLTPVSDALDFPEHGCDVFVHAHKHIREWIDAQYSNG